MLRFQAAGKELALTLGNIARPASWRIPRCQASAESARIGSNPGGSLTGLWQTRPTPALRMLPDAGGRPAAHHHPLTGPGTAEAHADGCPRRGGGVGCGGRSSRAGARWHRQQRGWEGQARKGGWRGSGREGEGVQRVSARLRAAVCVLLGGTRAGLNFIGGQRGRLYCRCRLHVYMFMFMSSQSARAAHMCNSAAPHTRAAWPYSTIEPPVQRNDCAQFGKNVFTKERRALVILPGACSLPICRHIPAAALRCICGSFSLLPGPGWQGTCNGGTCPTSHGASGATQLSTCAAPEGAHENTQKLPARWAQGSALRTLVLRWLEAKGTASKLPHPAHCVV